MQASKSIFESLIIILFAAIVAFYNLPLTGQQVAAETAMPATSTTTTTWPGSCGRPCALAGGIGMLDINNKCISIKNFYDERHCCINEDCSENICDKGVCILDKLYSIKLSWPVDSREVGCFGWRYDNTKPDDWEFNHGIDMFVAEGAEVKAMHSGRVVNCAAEECDTQADQSLGNYVVIADESGLFYTLYAHLKCGSIKVKLGDFVDEGDIIARSGGNDDCKGSASIEKLYIEVRYEKNRKESTINPCLALDNCDCSLSCKAYSQKYDSDKCERSL